MRPRTACSTHLPTRGGPRFAGGALLGVLLALTVLACGEGESGDGEAACTESDPGAVPLEVAAGSRTYRDRTVAASLVGTGLPGDAAAGEESAPRLLEVGPDGAVVDGSVPFQIDRFSAEAAEDTVQLVFALEGRTGVGQRRYFRLCPGRGAAPDPNVRDRVRLEGTQMHEGQESIVVRTDSAAYYYHRRGAAFASLHDADGRDWLSYEPGVGEESGSGSGGRFRGLPNMGYPEGYAHPGADTSRTEIVGDGPLRVSLYSTSVDGEMRIRWDLYPAFARLTVLRMRPPYWFLYEGTPGGVLDLQTDFWVRSGDEPGTRMPASEAWTGDLPGDAGGEWAYVEDGRLGRILFLTHHSDDAGIDSYRPMNEEMTVFGFGRRDLEKFMTETPNRFSVGFLESRPAGRIAERIRSFYDDPEVVVGPSD